MIDEPKVQVRKEGIARVLHKIRAVYAGWGPTTSVEQMRADWDQLFCSTTVNASYEPEEIAGVPCAWICAPGVRRDKLVLYLHGGGFKVGSTRSHFELMALLSRASGCQVLGLDYRLAPEHSFPAALEDTCAVYQDLLASRFRPSDVAIAGDSAGAGLALAALLALKKTSELGLPAAAVLFSPWTDLSASGESYQSRAKLDPLHRRSMILGMAASYLGGESDVRQALISPLFGDLGGLPPLFVQVGDHEVLLSDASALAESARQADVPVTLEVWEEMIHVFQQFPGDLEEARLALNAAGHFLSQQLTGLPPNGESVSPELSRSEHD
jgi:epsilon-lactone hydrolase